MRTLVVDGDSIAYAAATLDTRQEAEQTAVDKVSEILYVCRPRRVVVFLEREDGCSFRHHVATSRPYKAGRGPRPPWIAETKEAVWQMHNVVWSRPHLESEDECAVYATKNPGTMIACIDKDLLQVPGRFYDYRLDLQFEISWAAAWRNFYTQVLTGDSVDSIPGLPGVGPKKAEKILDGLTAPCELAAACAEAYRGRGYSRAYMLEQARLLYILRQPSEVFYLPESADAVFQ